MWSYFWRGALAGLAVVAAESAAAAQTVAAQPYAGLQIREIKALSDEEIADLKAGRGMGLALAAELNGYPGPRHVLELAERLGLSEHQRAGIEQLFDSMKAESVPIGEKLLAAERDLNRQFVERTITPDRLKAATAEIGAIRGELRNAHLTYHLSTAALLTPGQIRRYAELRGYAETGPGAHPGHSGAAGGMLHQHR